MTRAIHYTDDRHTVPKGAINIPIGDVFEKAAILSALAESCHFPEYFSYNWDSAYDCLTDGVTTQLSLSLTKVKNVNNQDLEDFKMLFEDAYKTYGKPQLWIVVQATNNITLCNTEF